MSTAAVTATCIGCGCDDEHGCWPFSCSWVRVDYEQGVGVCSECREHEARWDAGDRTPNPQPKETP